jgi:hypothetical protein
MPHGQRACLILRIGRHCLKSCGPQTIQSLRFMNGKRLADRDLGDDVGRRSVRPSRRLQKLCSCPKYGYSLCIFMPGNVCQERFRKRNVFQCVLKEELYQ